LQGEAVFFTHRLQLSLSLQDTADSGAGELQRGRWEPGSELGAGFAAPRHRVLCTLIARWHRNAVPGLHNRSGWVDGRGTDLSSGRLCEEK